MFDVIIQFIGLFLAGILAGEEFVVRWGVQPALTALEDRANILGRVALVDRLKVVVPAIMLPTVVVGVIVLVTGGIAAVEEGTIWPSSTTVFLHSGGVPDLFDHADAFARGSEVNQALEA